jgi:hypothetical protein
MTRNLLRLAALAFALSTIFALTPPLRAATPTCGSGTFIISCTKKCCGSGVMTTYNALGIGGSCSAAKSACTSCMPACPSGQSPCGGPTFGACGTV